MAWSVGLPVSSSASIGPTYAPTMVPPDKVCARCGRPFAWRKKWARDWEHVKYCSDACRRGSAAIGAAVDAAVMAVLDGRREGSSLGLDEIARALEPKRWRDRVDDVRAAAVRLALARRIVVTQGGRVIEPLLAEGSIQIQKAL